MQYWFKPRSGQTVVDIGAHIGKYTLKASTIVGAAGKVVSIEAHPETYIMLTENVRLNEATNVRTVNCAVWNETRSDLRLFIAQNSGCHSLKFDGGRGGLKVKARTIDDILDEQKVTLVDWMKIDVEGAEVEALEGARKIVAKSRPNILVEVRPFQMSRLKKFAEEYNYGIVEIGSEEFKGNLFSYWFFSRLPS